MDNNELKNLIKKGQKEPLTQEEKKLLMQYLDSKMDETLKILHDSKENK